MNWKTILTMLALVMIGYLAGFYHHRYLVHQRLSNIAESRIAPGVGERFFARINATEEQKEKLEPIIKKHMARLIQITEEMAEARKPILDSMRAEIDPLLSVEQKEDMERFLNHMKRMPRGRNGKTEHKRRIPGKNKE